MDIELGEITKIPTYFKDIREMQSQIDMWVWDLRRLEEKSYKYSVGECRTSDDYMDDALTERKKKHLQYKIADMTAWKENVIQRIKTIQEASGMTMEEFAERFDK